MSTILKKTVVEEGSLVESANHSLEQRVSQRYDMSRSRWYRLVAEEEVSLEYARVHSTWSRALEESFQNEIRSRPSDQGWCDRVDAGYLGRTEQTIVDYIKNSAVPHPSISKIRDLRHDG